MGKLSMTFFLDGRAKLAKEVHITMTYDRGVLLHIINQQDSFCVPDDRCQNLPGSGFNVRALLLGLGS